MRYAYLRDWWRELLLRCPTSFVRLSRIASAAVFGCPLSLARTPPVYRWVSVVTVVTEVAHRLPDDHHEHRDGGEAEDHVDPGWRSCWCRDREQREHHR